MNNIYHWIGKIVEESQYIQHNIALIICYHSINQKIKSKVLKENELVEISKKAWILNKEMSLMTMGQVIKSCQDSNAFDSKEIQLLYKFLKIRNEVVHKFFIANNKFFNDAKNIEKLLKILSSTLAEFKLTNEKFVEKVNSEKAFYKKYFSRGDH
ncbi:hypothetical protein [[Mycoplasma] anseris]|uniref:Uncharacterized protein n=1 Tax=[Mycoplasma] anseris TaxID=92400 RepID=A0A2Z4NDH0_9BACT|nr:hypothetical protein [[Mycoplasma] anseris]AWX69610.1 hypothetical protein DP065_02545 [[Mycoplasma] anseris]